MADFSDYRQDIIDYSDGFKDGYSEGTHQAILTLKSLLEEIIYDLGYDEATRWEIISNLSKQIKNTDFLDSLDNDLWNYIRSRD